MATHSVSSQVAGATSVDLAYSTTQTAGGQPASPLYAGAQVPTVDGLVKHTMSGLTAGTRYYAMLSNGSGTFYGNLISFVTLPANSGAWSMKLALVSCQNNQAGSQTTIGWDDIFAWYPDVIAYIGDYGYWGGHVNPTDPWQVHLGKYRDQTVGLPSLARALRNATHWEEADDHEYSGNNGDTYNDPERAHSIEAMQHVFSLHPLADPNAGSDPAAVRGLYGSFMLGSHVQVIMLDTISLDRSPALKADTSAKTFLGAAQDAWLRSKLTADVAVNILISGKAVVGTATGPNPPGAYQDKWWTYAQHRADLANWVASHTTTAGNPIKLDFWGGDRHRNCYVGKANNTAFPGHPAIVGSGIEQHSLPKMPGETYDVSYGDTTNKDQPMIGWVKIGLADNGTGTITRTVASRQVYDTWTGYTGSYPSGHQTDPAGWTIVDGWGGATLTDTWTY